jgi:hypothetical protein
MARTTTKTVEEIVEDLLPLYGPYDRDNTTRAAYLIAELVRYLNYATQNDESLPAPIGAYDLIGALKVAADRLPQALNQTNRRLAQFAQDPNVVDRRADYHREPAAAHAAAVEQLTQARAALHAAAAHAAALSRQLATVQNLLSPVGLNTAPTTDGDE